MESAADYTEKKNLFSSNDFPLHVSDLKYFIDRGENYIQKKSILEEKKMRSKFQKFFFFFKN